jgi:hypothetical protein
MIYVKVIKENGKTDGQVYYFAKEAYFVLRVNDVMTEATPVWAFCGWIDDINRDDFIEIEVPKFKGQKFRLFNPAENPLESEHIKEQENGRARKQLSTSKREPWG